MTDDIFENANKMSLEDVHIRALSLMDQELNMQEKIQEIIQSFFYGLKACSKEDAKKFKQKINNDLAFEKKFLIAIIHTTFMLQLIKYEASNPGSVEIDRYVNDFLNWAKTDEREMFILRNSCFNEVSADNEEIMEGQGAFDPEALKILVSEKLRNQLEEDGQYSEENHEAMFDEVYKTTLHKVQNLSNKVKLDFKEKFTAIKNDIHEKYCHLHHLPVEIVHGEEQEQKFIEKILHEREEAFNNNQTTRVSEIDTLLWNLGFYIKEDYINGEKVIKTTKV